MDSPCYDKKTKTDCPRRCGGCAVNCPEWAAYVAERNELYKQRARDCAHNDFSPGYKQRINNKKKKLRRGTWKGE